MKGYDMIWYDMVWYDIIWHDILICFVSYLQTQSINIQGIVIVHHGWFIMDNYMHIFMLQLNPIWISPINANHYVSWRWCSIGATLNDLTNAVTICNYNTFGLPCGKTCRRPDVWGVTTMVHGFPSNQFIEHICTDIQHQPIHHHYLIS